MFTRALRLLAVAALLVTVVGKYIPIENVHDPYIQELGGWAVSEYLKRGHVDGLLYGQVLSGEKYNYKLTGVYYKLVLDAMDTTATVKKYTALVFDRRGTRALKSFQRTYY